MSDVLDFLHVAWWWLRGFWEESEPLPPALVGIVLGVIAVLLLVPPVWRIARNGVTIVHEMAHVIVARLMGRRIHGIRLHTDTSGLAISSGKPRGFGILLTSIAGYPGPGIAGTAMLWAAAEGYGGASMTLLAALLAVAFLLARNVWGVLTTAAALAGTAWVLWQSDPLIVSATALGVGMFLTAGSLRTSIDLLLAHVRGDAAESDAVSAARNSLIPAFVWCVVFCAAAGVMTVHALVRGWEMLAL